MVFLTMDGLKDTKGLYKLYPKHNSGYLQVSKIHSIYWEEAGNPNGTPVIYLHGGPGYWNKPKSRKIFNPKKFHVILFDQRGGGRSKPFGETKENTTQAIVDDIEKLRVHLGLGKVIISGGSWGSTLALLYAQKYPKSVTRLLLRSIWLARQEDAEWLSRGVTIRKFFPDLWEEKTKVENKLVLSDGLFTKSAYRILINGSEKEKKFATMGLVNWENNLSRLYKEIKLTPLEKIDNTMILYAKLYLHFDLNNFFLTENQILDNISKIKDIPCHIIHCRYDMVCPLHQAWELHKKLPKSTIDIVHLSGHSDNVLSKRMVAYTDKLTK